MIQCESVVWLASIKLAAWLDLIIIVNVMVSVTGNEARSSHAWSLLLGMRPGVAVHGLCYWERGQE